MVPSVDPSLVDLVAATTAAATATTAVPMATVTVSQRTLQPILLHALQRLQQLRTITAANGVESIDADEYAEEERALWLLVATAMRQYTPSRRRRGRRVRSMFAQQRLLFTICHPSAGVCAASLSAQETAHVWIALHGVMRLDQQVRAAQCTASRRPHRSTRASFIFQFWLTLALALRYVRVLHS